MQVNASDVSISGMSKGYSQYSPLQSKRKESKVPSNLNEEYQYKTVETLEIDNLYNENVGTPGYPMHD